MSEIWDINSHFTSSQQSIGSSRQRNQAKLRNKRHSNQKERKKLSFTDDVILYLENPKKPLKKRARINKLIQQSIRTTSQYPKIGYISTH